MSGTKLATALLLVLAFAACDEDEGDGARVWADMDASERRAYMDEVVFPTMRDLFIEHDPDRYAGFSCQSCHGQDPEASGHAMPAFLGALPLEGTLEAAEARNPEMTAFMTGEVFPVFVELLGETKFAHDTNEDGYRCTGCHLVAD